MDYSLWKFYSGREENVDEMEIFRRVVQGICIPIFILDVNSTVIHYSGIFSNHTLLANGTETSMRVFENVGQENIYLNII